MTVETIRERQTRLKKERERRKKARSKTSCPAAKAAKSAKPLTQPKAPTFRSDQRAKIHQASAEKQPRPESERLFGKYTSLAASVGAFQTKTPQRFRRTRSRTAEQESGDAVPVSNKTPQLTHPQSPNLSAGHRASRSANYLTREEEEAKMMEEFKSKPFKAQPVAKAVLDGSGACGVMAIEKKELTQVSQQHTQYTPTHHRYCTALGTSCTGVTLATL